ncbi:nitroreductase/quinone reductase family protein [Nocardia pseudobrasiliensis]|uniref:Deazaflavin-dependent oxidoreductase (Nitroreductase family) n=1 Tax=Nocardia pseudobrasiliensis TaxID=45979 RepID=A0A370I693_9NOCA|nr:nitroreductase/quinone reductase family protein [Nocardia pseudobrasiliensis]RDI65631.1 deazaflavin-dependent oxidoreductase (nitroreductase family) [Nocardia pseudobrasiliensis]
MSSNAPVRLSITGRLTNFGSTHLGAVARLQGRLHSRLYARFGHTRFRTFLGRPLFRLTIVGRKSGQPRSVMLLRLHDGDDLIVVGSFSGNPRTPNWWLNLVAAGTATAEADGRAWPVTVRVVTDPTEYDRRWQALTEFYPDLATYRELSTRRFPIAVLSPADA